MKIRAIPFQVGNPTSDLGYPFRSMSTLCDTFKSGDDTHQTSRSNVHRLDTENGHLL